MIRTKGEAGSGNIVEAVRHMRTVMTEIKRVTRLDQEELVAEAKHLGASLSLLQEVAKTGKLPVPNFAAGGIATPADASLMMQLGAETVFVGSGIFKSDDPISRAKAVVKATANYQDSQIVAEASTGLKKAMKGLDISEIPEDERMQERGW
jgi:pyridoxal 5'-phosphate synthase pdxS subunit